MFLSKLSFGVGYGNKLNSIKKRPKTDLKNVLNDSFLLPKYPFKALFGAFFKRFNYYIKMFSRPDPHFLS